MVASKERDWIQMNQIRTHYNNHLYAKQELEKPLDLF